MPLLPDESLHHGVGENSIHCIFSCGTTPPFALTPHLQQILKDLGFTKVFANAVEETRSKSDIDLICLQLFNQCVENLFDGEVTVGQGEQPFKERDASFLSIVITNQITEVDTPFFYAFH